jgi:hypothetical protein
MKRTFTRLIKTSSLRSAFVLAIALLLMVALVALATVGPEPRSSSASSEPATADGQSSNDEPAQPSAGPPSPATATASAEAEAVDGPMPRLAGGGAKQIVRIENRRDGTYRGRGRTQFNQINAPRVVPVNIAIAQSTLCNGCETLAVALQISLYRSGAPLVAPQNAAAAVNAGCNGCFTVAVAIQYLIPVSNPNNVPADVRQMARELDAALRELANDRRIPVRDRLAALQEILDRFHAFAAYLDLVIEQQSEPDGASNSGVPTPLPDETSDPDSGTSPTASPAGEQSDSASPSPAGEPAATPAPSESPTSSPSPTPTPTSSPSPTPTPTSSPSPTPTPASTPSTEPTPQPQTDPTVEPTAAPS